MTRCPVLDESFPFMLPGWRAEKTPGVPFDSDSVGPVGPYGTLSTSDSDSVGPLACVGRCTRLTLLL